MNAVRSVAELLRAEQIEYFFSPDDLCAGENWLSRLEHELEKRNVLMLCIGPSGLGPWQEEEYQAAIIRRRADPSFVVIPVILPGVAKNPETIPVFLRNTQWCDLSSGISRSALLRVLETGTKRRHLWYYDDSHDALERFAARHRSNFSVRCFSNPAEFAQAVISLADPGAQELPDALLIDMYGHKDTAEVTQEVRDHAMSMLSDFFRMERELKSYVDQAWRPDGTDLVKMVRQYYSPEELPVAIYTQRGLVLLEDELIGSLEKRGVHWLLKRRFEPETERLILGNMIERSGAEPARKPRVLYVEDSPKFRNAFARNHREYFDIELLTRQGEVIPRLRELKRTGAFPHLLLVDLYYPRTEGLHGRAAIEVAEGKLEEFHQFEHALRSTVASAFDPLGISLVETVRTVFDPSKMPIVIYTQTGLLLLEDGAIRRLEELKAGWLLKDRYSAPTEAIKILRHIVQCKEPT